MNKITDYCGIGIRYVLSTGLEAMNELRFACKLYLLISSNGILESFEFRAWESSVNNAEALKV